MANLLELEQQGWPTHRATDVSKADAPDRLPSCYPDICFVAPAAWPILAGSKEIQGVGGAEVQQCTIARALANAGYPISMICLDYGQPDQCVIDGVTVYKAHRPEAGFPVLRFYHPRLTSIWNALRRADADIYYQRSASMLTGVVAGYCRHNQRRSIYAGAHDTDFLPGGQMIQYRRDVMLFEYGLRHVDAIVTQNTTQKNDCFRHYRRDSVLIPSCYIAPASGRQTGMDHILWVSTVRRWKRPEIFLELARRLPQFKFRMIGGPGGKDIESRRYFGKIEAAARIIPNLEFLGFVPYAEIDAHFDSAKVFVNTSLKEGFPNTFLQSWSRCIPTVSFIDTGSQSAGESVSSVAKDVDEATRIVLRLMEDEAEWRRRSRLCRLYFDVQHSVQTVVAIYGELFLSLIKDVPSSLSAR